MSEISKTQIVIKFQFQGEAESRLDKALSVYVKSQEGLETITRSQLKQRIEAGEVSINGIQATKAGAMIAPGDSISCHFKPRAVDQHEPYNFELDILFEDESLLVLNKPAGLTVHPGAGTGHETLLGALVHRYGPKPESVLSRMGIVHRLDRDTTGVMVVARTSHALSSLSEQFSNRTIERRYQCLVALTPRAKRLVDLSDSGTIETRIGRHPSNRTLMSVVKEGGKRAVSHWSVRERFVHGALLEVKLETGRTHQIRVHMNHIESPVVGDRDYGGQNILPTDLERFAKSFGRQALHAGKLGFSHPKTDKYVEFESPPPKDFLNLVEQFRSY